MRKSKAFTLAEVLIVLSIIGIIAALTIPTLVEKYQNEEYVTILKKTYSQIYEALKEFSNDYGSPNDIVSTGYFDSYYQLNTMQFQRAFVKYFKTAKDCGAESTDANESVQGCFPAATYGSLTGTGSNPNNIYFNYEFITEDGAAIGICSNGDSPGCAGGECATITIDVNGPKPPNRVGRDTFRFQLYNQKWTPSGYVKGITLISSENYTNSVITNGWKMTY